MKEKIDLKTLRMFPYVIFAMLITFMFSTLSTLVELIRSRDVGDVIMNQMNNTLYMMCYFFIYLAIVGILSCLYHMSLISKWFGVACNLTGAYIIAEAVVFVLNWISTLIGEQPVYDIVFFIVKLLPTLCLMLIIVYVLHGAAFAYVEMNKKKKALSCLKTEVYWIASFVIQILMNIIIHIDPETNQVTLFYGLLLLGIYIYNLVVVIILYIRIKGFCYDYYIYSHNQSI